MAFTYGFYNSLRGDRKYNVEQVSELFDGILKDGIIPSQGQLFAVSTANNGMQINVGTGRAWFNHTWSKNDSVMVLTVPQSDITRPRYDAVVLEVDHNDAIRANSIKIVQGVAATNPVKPTLVNNDKVHQYPLAWILVPAAAETITASNIENAVGLEPTVFATGVLESVSIDQLWAQWQGDWTTWFEGIKLQLSGDVVTNLQLQIDQLKTQFDEFAETFEVRWVTKTDTITSSQTWTNPTAKPLTVTLLMFGGGGGGGTQRAGGGGNMARGTATVPANGKVSVTIGTGGAKNSNGGTTSFGTYLSANGGTYDGSGGSGGGGSFGNYGASANYGGGGGGGGQGGNGTPSPGGNGGMYGGGGGGGGALSTMENEANYPSEWLNGASGGTGGQYGGSGGKGGDAGRYYGGNFGTPSGGSAGIRGTNTSSQSATLEFVGPGNGGAGGALGEQYGTYWIPSGGGGGGGGGYGGNGGSGGASHWGSTNGSKCSSGGGGGGGYGAAGGNGQKGQNTSGGGGGGGGYGGKGGNAGGYSGQGYGAGGGTDVSGATNEYYKIYGGGGGGGYGTGIPSTQSPSGHAGICIITYTVKEIGVN